MKEENLIKYKIKAQKIFKELNGHCIAIYLGGSSTQKYLKHNGDIDFVFFVKSIKDSTYVKTMLELLQKDKPYYFKKRFCVKQIEIVNDTNDYYKVEYWSYMYKDMILLAGEEINFTFEPLSKDKQQFVNYLKNSIKDVTNKKHYYHYYRCYLLLKKQNYKLSRRQIKQLNLLHDSNADEKLIEKVKRKVEGLK